MFFRGSRYVKVPDHEIGDSDNRVIRYKGIRIIGDVRSFRVHMLREDERLDRLAFQYYRDPERFWRICDANEVMWPDELLLQTGQLIRISPPEGT